MSPAFLLGHQKERLSPFWGPLTSSYPGPAPSFDLCGELQLAPALHVDDQQPPVGDARLAPRGVGEWGWLRLVGGALSLSLFYLPINHHPFVKPAPKNIGTEMTWVIPASTVSCLKALNSLGITECGPKSQVSTTLAPTLDKILGKKRSEPNNTQNGRLPANPVFRWYLEGN